MYFNHIGYDCLFFSFPLSFFTLLLILDAIDIAVLLRCGWEEAEPRMAKFRFSDIYFTDSQLHYEWFCFYYPGVRQASRNIPLLTLPTHPLSWCRDQNGS